MNKEEIRRILSVSRPRGQDSSDPLIAEAAESAARDPELANWLAQEQSFDRRFTEALKETPVPAGLKIQIMASLLPRIARRPRWPRRVASLAAAIIILLVFFSSWRGLFQPTASLGDFRSEMVSFVKLTPPLELEATKLDRIQDWLKQVAAPAEVSVPPGLAALQPIGCRVLLFRGEKVTLICFRRGEGKLAHLFVVDRAALPALRLGNKRTFAQEGNWMTASWQKDGRLYLLATQGDRKLLKHYLGPDPKG